MDHKTVQRAAREAPDARVVKTRAALHDALLALVADKPLDQITVRDITAEAGTGYATFFRHYPSKSALLDEIVAEQVGELMTRGMALLDASGSRPAALAMCHYIDQHRKLWTALLTGGAIANVREEFIRQAGAEAKAHVPPKTTLPGDLSVVFGVVGAVEILAWWIEKGKNVSVEEIAAIIDRLVIAPVYRAP
jgi:AcrR family transcriptional regulator